MKVLPVSNFNVYQAKTKIKNNPNFQGLWGEKTYYSQHDSTYDIEDTYLHYYPFKDESYEEAKAETERQERHSHYMPPADRCSDSHDCYNDTSVEIHKNLPFTTQDFEDYKNGRVSPLKREVIERYILEKNLKENC